jgi:type II secretion system protein H
MFYHKPTPGDRGFTLLEMMLVLSILVIVALMAVPATSGLVARARLKAQARLLQDYAASARRLAVTEGRPYEIILDERSFLLEPSGGDAGKKEDAVGSAKLASNVRYSVRHWGVDEFETPEGEPWVFRPDGICEPLRVHFQNGDGWIEYSFNPLTAGPVEEDFHFQ